jgi:hypothetical protein
MIVAANTACPTVTVRIAVSYVGVRRQTHSRTTASHELSAMPRAAALIGAFIAGIAAAALALYVSLQAAPGVIMADDMADALAAAAEPYLSRFPAGSVVYVKSSLGAAFLERLQAGHSTLRLMPFSARPQDSGCGPGRSAIPAAPCDRNDFLKLEVLSSLTPGTMLVAIGTSNTYGQALLLRLWSRWRVLVHRSYRV